MSVCTLGHRKMQKNSCSKMWSIVQLYIKLGPNYKSFFTGLPHGPFWIYSRFFEQMVFVHFENGELIPENVVLVDEKNYQFAVKGKLVNYTFLENPVKVQIDGVGEHNCLQVIKTSELPEEKVLDQGK